MRHCLSRVLLFCALCAPVLGAPAASISLEAGSIIGPDWQAHGASLQAGADGTVRLRVQQLQLSALDAPLAVELNCPATPILESGWQCRGGSLQAQLPELGQTRARIDISLHSTARWSLDLRDLRSSKLAVEQLRLTQRPEQLQFMLRLPDTDLAAASTLLQAFVALPMEFTVSGSAGGSVSGTYVSAQRWEVEAALHMSELSFSDMEGRYAGELLAGEFGGTARQQGSALTAQPELHLHGGQIYLEPVFTDFTEHPLRGGASLQHDSESGVISLTDLRLTQQGVLDVSGSARVVPGQAQPLVAADLQLHEGQFPALADTYLQPFLAGGQFDPLQSAGRMSAHLLIDDGVPQRLSATLVDVNLAVVKLDAEITGLDGDAEWRAGNLPAVASRLRWTGGRAARLPLGGGEAAFTMHGAAFRIDRPLRLPLLDGAFNISRLALRGIGTPEMGADFAAVVEPLNLRLLTQALEWPEMSGRLAGQIPGVSLEAGTVELDGALTAQVFDGEITISALRIIDAFSVVPRIAADLRMRNLDLLTLTETFAFGSIEGRLDGDVTGLRMLGGRPVAFDARIYTPSGDRSRRRISQRAIDNISAVAGGPSGIVSGGLLRFFSDFPYRRIGWSCRLHDNVCHMDGVAPADNNGYVLVQGSGLPRINVIGFGRRVDWPTFIRQLESVRLDEAGDP